DPELTFDRRDERDMSERIPACCAELAHAGHVTVRAETQHGSKHLRQLALVLLCHSSISVEAPVKVHRRIRRRRASTTSRRASWATRGPGPFLSPRNEGSRVPEAKPGSPVAGRSSGTTCSRGARPLPSSGPKPPHPEWRRSHPGSRRA